MVKVVAGRRMLGMAMVAAFIATGGTGCRKEAEILKGFQAKLDPNLSKAEKAALVSDATRLTELEYKEGTGGLFAIVFQGENPTAGVLKYLDERVSYVFSARTDLDSLLRSGPRFQKVQSETEAEGSSNESRALLMAMNVGMGAWWMHEAMGPQDGVYFKFEGRKIPISSSRIGLIQLGDGYVAERVEPMDRLETLVHEGRHSDCTGGMSRLDVLRLKLGQIPENSACGHAHAICPDGHPMAGIPACDLHPWGAYTIGALFTVTVSQRCTNCSESERLAAELSSYDSLSRVEPGILETSLKGGFGPPDMWSQGLLPN
jgi:hypothetical protein